MKDKGLIEAFKAEENKLKIYKKVQKAIDHWQKYSLEEKGKFLVDIPQDISMLPGEQQEIFIKELARAEICKKRELTKNVKKFKRLKPEEEEQPKVKFNPEPYSETILKKYSLKYDNKHRLFIWNKSTGLWDEDAVSILNSILRRKLLGKRDYKRYCVEEIIAHLKGLCRVSELPPEPPPYLLPFKNLIYNLDTDTTEEYSPDYFFINKFQVNYIKGVGYKGTNQIKGDVVMEILKQIIPEDHLIDLLELAAYCMWRGYPYPKMFILYGDGRNGKSAYYDLLIRIFGLENISTVTSLDLQRHRFSSGRLYGKLLNVTSEMEYEDLKKTSLIKKLTGGDPLDCERKFKETFLFNNYAKQIFITNSVPETSDKTLAFYSRPFLTEFPRKFEEGINAEPNIIKKLAEDEIEGFAYKLIPILNDLRAREPSEFVFTNHKDIEKTKEEYEKLSTPLAHYIKDNTVEDATGLVYQSDLLQRYMQFVTDKGGRGYSGKMLSEKMRDLGYISNNRNPRQRVAYEGIRWKEDTKEDLFEIPE